MQIITTEQAVLNLILEYLDNPNPIVFKNTLKKIREHWPITEHSMSLDWEFKLTNQSFVNLSKKYLNQDLQRDSPVYILLVDSIDLSFKILSYEEYVSNLPRIMNRTFLAL